MRGRRAALWTAGAVVILAGLAACGAAPDADSPAVFGAGAAPDYQLGGAYDPAEEVRVVARDRTSDPAPGVYSICYLNGFQSQPGELDVWPDAAILSGPDGEPVFDPAWPDEALLDTSTGGGRSAIIERLGGWIRECAGAGFDAVEFDNLDTFTRSDGALSLHDAVDVARALVDIAHDAGIAAGQKNAAEYAQPLHDEAGFDFAVAEECAAFDECGAYTEVYGDALIDIEYTDALPRPFAQVCDDPATPRSVVLRDRDLTTPGDPDYVFELC